MNIQQSTLQRFWKSVDKLGPASDYTDDRCWIWTGTTNKSGYGKLSVGGKSVYSHRFSYFLATGELPSEVRHLCRNSQCCRPNHLVGGDSSSNLIDQLIHRLKDSL
jgi:hypothetical protein